MPQKDSLVTIEEFIKHNSQDDCWIVINNRVINVTKFAADEHDGGRRAIVRNAGQDVTEKFLAKGFHRSEKAKEYLDKFQVGVMSEEDVAKLRETTQASTTEEKKCK